MLAAELHCSIDEIREMKYDDFVKWKWFLPEFQKARNGDKSAFKDRNPFAPGSVEAQLFNATQ